MLANVLAFQILLEEKIEEMNASNRRESDWQGLVNEVSELYFNSVANDDVSWMNGSHMLL